MVYLSGQLSYFMSICTYVLFVLLYIDFFILFGMLAIREAAALKKRPTSKLHVLCAFMEFFVIIIE